MRLKTWIYSAVSGILAIVAIVFVFHFTSATPSDTPAGNGSTATATAGNGNTDDGKGGATNAATGKPGENK